MSLDPHRHVDAHVGLYKDLVSGERVSADKRRRFYDDYFAVMDLPAEFYLETVQPRVPPAQPSRGKDAASRKPGPAGRHPAHGADDRRGGEDDITTPGQTHAAHGLLTGIPAGWKEHHLQEGAGHYGTFSGRRFRRRLLSKIRAFFRTAR